MQLLLKVEKTLHDTYSTIRDFATQQQVADALEVLEEAYLQIKNPAININQLKPPSTKLNRKIDTLLRRELKVELSACIFIKSTWRKVNREK